MSLERSATRSSGRDSASSSVTTCVPSDAIQVCPLRSVCSSQPWRSCGRRGRRVVPWRFGSISGTRARKRGDHRFVAGGHRRSRQSRAPLTERNLMLLALLPGLRRQRRAHRYDVSWLVCLSGRLCDRASGTDAGGPVVVKCHGSRSESSDRPSPWSRFQFEHVLPRARTVVVVSRHFGDRALRLGVRPITSMSFSSGSTTALPAGGQARGPSRLSLPVTGKSSVYVGHLAEHEGVRDLLQASPSSGTRASGYVAVYLGHAAWLEAREAARPSPGPRDIVVVDAVAHDEVPSSMAATVVLCLPSWTRECRERSPGGPRLRSPVVATGWGYPEAVGSTQLGIARCRPAAGRARGRAGTAAQPASRGR